MNGRARIGRNCYGFPHNPHTTICNTLDLTTSLRTHASPYPQHYHQTFPPHFCFQLSVWAEPSHLRASTLLCPLIPSIASPSSSCPCGKATFLVLASCLCSSLGPWPVPTTCLPGCQPRRAGAACCWRAASEGPRLRPVRAALLLQLQRHKQRPSFFGCQSASCVGASASGGLAASQPPAAAASARATMCSIVMIVMGVDAFERQTCTPLTAPMPQPNLPVPPFNPPPPLTFSPLPMMTGS
jgi:hypothetical protein